jgi:endonuclease/exonuclease/phosphatase family metal-dependent hydrolase
MNYWLNTRGNLDQVISWKNACIEYLLYENNIDFLILQEINPFKLFEKSLHHYFLPVSEYNILYSELKWELSLDGRKDNFWGNAILFRKCFTLKSNNMKANYKYYYGRNAIMCYDFKSSDGELITIINVYNKKNYMKKGAYTMINDLKNDNDIIKIMGREDNCTILAGDFNTFAKDSNGRLKDLEDNFKQFKLFNCTTCTENMLFHTEPTYYDFRYGYGIDDFCFISENIKNNYRIAIDIPKEWNEKYDKNHRWKGLSDHAPIIVTFDTN